MGGSSMNELMGLMKDLCREERGMMNQLFKVNTIYYITKEYAIIVIEA